MLRVLEFLTGFYWLLLPQTILQALFHANWRQAFQKAGSAGILHEGWRSLIGTNAWSFFVPIDSRWSGYAIERLLARYGIEIWGWGFANGTLFFHVHESDAYWACDIMLKAGVPLLE